MKRGVEKPPVRNRIIYIIHCMPTICCILYTTNRKSLEPFHTCKALQSYIGSQKVKLRVFSPDNFLCIIQTSVSKVRANTTSLGRQMSQREGEPYTYGTAWGGSADFNDTLLTGPTEIRYTIVSPCRSLAMCQF